VCVAGVTGWTGRAVADAVGTAEDLELVAGVSRSDPASFSTVEEALDAVPTDVLVDYTTAAAVKGHVLAALDRCVAVIVGSSGLSAADYAEIDELARQQRVGVIAAGNFSLMAALLLRFATEAARHLGSWELIDYATLGKPDAPSGTARELAERLTGGTRRHRRHDAGALAATAELQCLHRDRLRRRRRAALDPPRCRLDAGTVRRRHAPRDPRRPRTRRRDEGPRPTLLKIKH
jgi:dihydrodipicolinate reductase